MNKLIQIALNELNQAFENWQKDDSEETKALFAAKLMTAFLISSEAIKSGEKSDELLDAITHAKDILANNS